MPCNGVMVSKFVFQTILTVCIYPTNPPWPECNTTSIFKQSKADLSSEFTFSLASSHTKAKELSLPHYLSKAEGVRKRDGFKLFSSMKMIHNLACPGFELIFIFYNNNHYTIHISTIATAVSLILTRYPKPLTQLIFING